MEKRILSELWIYPIKSLGGIRLSSSQVMEKGLRNDRRWMLVDQENGFMTQRVYPKMSQFKVNPSNLGFEIRYGEESIQLPLDAHAGGEVIQSHVWKDSVEVIEVPGTYGSWFSDRLGINCRLVAFPEGSPRPVDARYSTKRVGIAQENVSLADGYPLLIIGQASLDDLNRRLTEPVPMNRFRPNLVFLGGQPYEEDMWSQFTVGKNRFAGVKPCDRCVLTTINQETGEKGREPLLTLSRYRKQGEKINFGQNVIPIDYQEIHEGDEITVN